MKKDTQQVEYTTTEGNYGKNYHNSQNLENFQRLRRQKGLTLCLELLEKQGLTGDAAIFILSVVGGVS